MKIVVISMINRLLSGAIIKYLRERGELMPIRVMDCSKKNEPYITCKSHEANILLMEVMKISPFTLEERLKTAAKMKKSLPHCKIVVLCDENADPDMAEKVKEAKKMGFIDSFFYSSVSGEYLAAMLDAL
ncbi:MAG TPA: hypothetical protein VFD89_01690 [Clostridia bacterium]|nr:hypothetical protein [Clostridia bacterium]